MLKTPSTRPSDPRPDGLLFHVHARMKGRFRWQVLDENGNPEAPIGADGKPLAYSGGWQDNLITNLGLNRVGTVHMWMPTASFGTQIGWRSYLAVGTGSATPDVTDAALDAEVQRGNSNGTTPANPTLTLATGDDVFRSVQVRDVQVTMSADRNLTEWGLSDQNSVGVNIRELFRDDMNNPITISLLNGKTLRLQHELTIEIPAPAAGTADSFNIHELDAANNPVGTTPYDLIQGPTGLPNNVFNVWHPISTEPQGFTPVGYLSRLTSGSYNRVTMVPGVTDTNQVVALETYVGDSFERIKRRTIPANAMVGVYNGIGVYTGISGGFAFCFDDPATFTKANTHTLQVGIVVTWARA